jgi:hypothetical protein
VKRRIAHPAIAIINLALVGFLLLPAQSLAASPPLQTPEVAGEADVTSAITTGTYYDSGWVPLAQGTCETVTHDLGGNPDDYTVEMWFQDTNATGFGINRRGYGGTDLTGSQEGAHWEQLTSDTIDLCRGPLDTAADQVRARVWIPARAADFASPWTPIEQGLTIGFLHNLNLPPEQLIVSLWFKSAGRGIHHLGYGGLDIDDFQEMRGAYWHELTDNAVHVTRRIDDEDVEEVRVLVAQAGPPNYDSDWQPLFVGPNLFRHNLIWHPDDMLVQVECFVPAAGIHQKYVGGNEDWLFGRQGTSLQNLAAHSLNLVRWHDDQVCPQARVRIWQRSDFVSAPLVPDDN